MRLEILRSAACKTRQMVERVIASSACRLTTVNQDGGDIVEAPLTGDAIMLGGFARGQRDDFELFVGGKSSAADRNAEHLASQRGRAADSGFARASRCCDCNRTRWRLVNWKAAPRPPTARPADSERPKLEGLNCYRMSSRERLQPLLCGAIQDNRRSKWVWHGRHPCRETRTSCGAILPT